MLQEHKKISVMFPRYLFVWIEDQWRSLLGTSGVAAVLLDCGKPAPLPANFVDGLKAKENKNGCVYLPRYRYRKGQTVQITGGVFSGLFGMYQGSCSHDREVVLLNVLGRVELASSDLF
jgi:transcription antitermination factor NusG